MYHFRFSVNSQVACPERLPDCVGRQGTEGPVLSLVEGPVLSGVEGLVTVFEYPVSDIRYPTSNYRPTGEDFEKGEQMNQTNTSDRLEDLKVAIVHDWLTGMRGGEKVLEILCELFPQADLFTLLHIPGSVSPAIEAHKITTSFIDRLPFKKTKYRHYLPLFPTAIEQFDLKNYHLILSTSHCVAKGVITPPEALHISYLHTPMRYVWDMYHDYFGEDKIGWLSGKIIPLFANYLRIWDVTSSNRVDWFLANSQHVANRIGKFYRREATVIHPPVDTKHFSAARGNRGFDLVVSALVPYKRIDLAVSAYNRMKKKLVVVGEGPELGKLKNLAGSTIEFIDWQPPEKLVGYYRGCRMLIFPGEEDFGIVPVEAMACGKPVVAFAKGGALETVIGFTTAGDQPATGIFFQKQQVNDLISAVERAEQIEWDTNFIAAHARKFDTSVFREKMLNFIREKTQLHFSK